MKALLFLSDRRGFLRLNSAFYVAFLTIFLFILVFALILVKARATPYFAEHPLAVSYGFFVSGFILYRLIASLFYPASLRKIAQNLGSKKYEPFVSFVVPVLNEEGVIAQTVERCFAVHYPHEKLEVIIINDGSTDRTGSILHELRDKRFPNLVVIDFPQNKGKRHGMVEGFRRARGEIVVQLDSDSSIEATSFRKLIEPFADPSIGAVCAHADPSNASENFITKMQAAYYYMSFRILKAAESTFGRVFCCSGCSSAYRKDLVLPIMDQWLDERFLGERVTYGDDRALTSWVLRLGYRTIYTHEVQAYTIVPTTFRKLLKQQLRWKKSWIINAFITGRFIFRVDPYVALTYFFPLVLISVITPLLALHSIFIAPFFDGLMPHFYILGNLIITGIIVTYYRFLDRRNPYALYLFGWSVLNMIVFSYVMIYAFFRLKDRGWGTR